MTRKPAETAVLFGAEEPQTLSPALSVAEQVRCTRTHTYTYAYTPLVMLSFPCFLIAIIVEGLIVLLSYLSFAIHELDPVLTSSEE